MNGMISPIERLKVDPVASARAQVWLERLKVRQQQAWPALRDQMLAAAQRAEDMRDTVLLRLTK